MGAVRHLIARQTIEIVTADRVAAETLSARTSQAADRLATTIERSLDSVETAGLDLRIDRIELDLGPCDPAGWEDELADGIRRALARKIAEAVDHGEAVHRDPAAAALALLGEFARSGRLPWWAAAGDTPEGAIRVLVSADCEPASVHAVLLRSGAVERFVNQLDERSLTALMCLAGPGLSDEDVAGILAFAEARPDAPPAERGAARADRAATWRAMLEEVARAASSGEPVGEGLSRRPRIAKDEVKRFRDAVAHRLGIGIPAPEESGEPGATRANRDADGSASQANAPRDPAKPSGSLSQRLRTLASRYPPAAALFNRLAGLASHLNARAVQEVEALLDAGSVVDLPALVAIFAEAGAIRADEADPWRNQAAAARTPAPDEEHDALAVANSGLVLLWPFLPRFFAGLGLLDDDRFRDAAAQHRAATLLHYLAGGDVACAEQDLPLAKILSGVEIDAIHTPGEPLDAYETDTADALLEAVLGHAPMLGRISIGGLREAFLMRPGLLATRDGHWLLRAERRSIDVLLDRLPWTFAWVRLPWMAEPLQIEW